MTDPADLSDNFAEASGGERAAREARVRLALDAAMATGYRPSFKDPDDLGGAPLVVDPSRHGDRMWDIYSSLMKQSRIIHLTGGVNDQVCELLKATLLYLEHEPAPSTLIGTDIRIFIDSPGGAAISGLSVVDVMNHINVDVGTIVAGMAASMGSIIAAAGKPGKRWAFPNSEIMVHASRHEGHGLKKRQNLGEEYKQTVDLDERVQLHYTVWMGLDPDNKDDWKLVGKLMAEDTFMNTYMAMQCGILDGVMPLGTPNDPAKKKLYDAVLRFNERKYHEIDFDPDAGDNRRYIKDIAERRKFYSDEAIRTGVSNPYIVKPVVPATAPVNAPANQNGPQNRPAVG